MNYRLRDGLTRGGTDNNGSYVANNATLLQKVRQRRVPRRRHRRLARLHALRCATGSSPTASTTSPPGALGAADYISRWITLLFTEPCPKADRRPDATGSPIHAVAPDGQSAARVFARSYG